MDFTVNKLYFIVTKDEVYKGYFVSANEDSCSFWIEETNNHTCDNEKAASFIKVPCLITFNKDYILSYNRIYNENEYETYYLASKSKYSGIYGIVEVYLTEEQFCHYNEENLFVNREEAEKFVEEANKKEI